MLRFRFEEDICELVRNASSPSVLPGLRLLGVRTGPVSTGGPSQLRVSAPAFWGSARSGCARRAPDPGSLPARAAWCMVGGGHTARVWAGRR